MGVDPSAWQPQRQQNILPQQSPNSENLKQVTEGPHTDASPEQDGASAIAHPLLQNPSESGGVRCRGVCKLRHKARQKEVDCEIPGGAWFPGGTVVSDAGLPSGMRELGGGRGVYIFKERRLA